MVTKKATKQAINDYNADSIESLSPRQYLYKRLSLTFGREGTDPDYAYSLQKNVAIREILDNAIDEIRAGYGKKVRVHIFKDGHVEIQDSGRGIPVDVNSKTHESGIFASLGHLQSGGKFATQKSYSSGLNGVGASAAVFCSSRTDVIVYRNHKKYELSFNRGDAGFFDGDTFHSLVEMGKKNDYLRVSKDDRSDAEKEGYETGTIVRIWLDPDVFTCKKPFDDQDIVNRTKFTAFLVPQLEAEVINECGKTPFHEVFHYPDGITSMCDYLAPTNGRLTPIQLVSTKGYYTEEAPVLQSNGEVKIQPVSRDVPIKVAFLWNNDDQYRLYSFVNTIHTVHGGVHCKAFEQALLKAFNDKIATMRGKVQKGQTLPIIDDYKLGLTVVLSVEQSEPIFTAQSKEELSGSENQKAIKEALIDAFSSFISAGRNKSVVDTICNKIAEESRIRQSEKASRDAQRKLNANMRSTLMPPKLVDCKYVSNDLSELHICEGDSALGGLKSARDSRFQALLPIRGKIISAYKNDVAKVLENKEVQGIITCLGAGYGADFDIDKMRYGKVIISTDADSDGFDIQCLLLVLFWSFFQEVIKEGRLYISYPPLFEVTMKQGGEEYYALNRTKLNEIEQKLNEKGYVSGKHYTVSRDKGLGSMTPEAARKTLMNPETRVLKRITMQDVKRAEHMLDLAMGKDVAKRQQWISDNFDDLDSDAMDF